jgi:hypothetical protein
MRADLAEFQRLDLRCHSLLVDVPIHDVWTIPLAGGGPNRTMRDAYAISPFVRISSTNVLVRGLFALRRVLGRRLRWDEQRHDPPAESYIHRLADADRAQSLVTPGAREGAFRMLYLFPGGAVLELRNATAHAFVAIALKARPGGYVLYWAIYVKPVGSLTHLYMTLIDPFRRFVVYPALIRQTQAAWSRAYT